MSQLMQQYSGRLDPSTALAGRRLFRTRVGVGLCVTLAAIAGLGQAGHARVRIYSAVMRTVDPGDVKLGGLLGAALDAHVPGRLASFIEGPNSAPVTLFSPAVADRNTEGTDWHGEHAGKWLYTAARAARRTGDRRLGQTVRDVADYLIAVQRPNGYLGTYAPAARMTSTTRRVQEENWDVWVHGYLLMGLLEVQRYEPDDATLQAARKIGDLLIETFGTGQRQISFVGRHFGMASTSVLEPIVALYEATGQKPYLDFAERIVRDIEARPGLQLLSRSLKEYDLQQIGNGKIYEQLRHFVGLARLYQVTGHRPYLDAAQHAWRNITAHHLTPGGGPWGGIDGHQECFNPEWFFSPDGLTETCAVMEWMRLNIELLKITGYAQYAEEIEKSAYNALLGAMAPNGSDWCYYSALNGPRVPADDWACCKSSGAMALEEIAPVVFGRRRDGLAVNLFTSGTFGATLDGATDVTLTQITDYPRTGRILLSVTPEEKTRFTLYLRHPEWADPLTVTVNGVPVRRLREDAGYIKIQRQWQPGDRVSLQLSMVPRIVGAEAVFTTTGRTTVPRSYAALLCGSLLFAAGADDPNALSGIVTLDRSSLKTHLQSVPPPAGFDGPAFELAQPDNRRLLLLPYYEAGGRRNNIYRTTWLQTR